MFPRATQLTSIRQRLLRDFTRFEARRQTRRPAEALNDQETALLDSYEYSLHRVKKSIGQREIDKVLYDLSTIVGVDRTIIEKYFEYMKLEEGQVEEPEVRREEGEVVVCFQLGEWMQREADRRVAEMEKMVQWADRRSEGGNVLGDNGYL